MANRRVVITGMGICSPLGMNVNLFWSNLLNKVSGITTLSDLFSFLPSRVAGSIPDYSLDQCKLSVKDYVNRHFNPAEWPCLSRAGVLAVLSVCEALKQAKWKQNSGTRAGVYFGAGITGVDEFVNTSLGINAQQFSAIGPRTLVKTMANIPSGIISQIWGLRGPCMTLNTACATGLHCIGEAYRIIKYGEADLMVAGASESTINPWTVAAFARLRALCTKYNNNSKEASRPFDDLRSGFVLSEGAATVILQSWPPKSEFINDAFIEHPTPLAEIIGFGRSADAYGTVSPELTGNGALRSMETALEDAKIGLDQIGHINCHATSTPLGDVIELSAISQLLNNHVSQSSTSVNLQPILINSIKGHLGHCLSAAGAIETVYSVLSVNKGLVAPNLNLHNPITADELSKQLSSAKAVPLESIEKCLDLFQNYTILPTQAEIYNTSRTSPQPRIAMTNSFGFGGTNGTLILSEWMD